MKLKQVLSEMMADKDVVYKNIFGKNVKLHIFQNPTPEELKETEIKEPRAVKTIDGKIYTVSNQEENGIIHEDIVEILSGKDYITNSYNESWWKELKSLDSYICIVRNRGRWVISESYNLMKIKWEEFEELVKSKYNNVSTEYKE